MVQGVSKVWMPILGLCPLDSAYADLLKNEHAVKVLRCLDCCIGVWRNLKRDDVRQGARFRSGF